MLNEIIEKICLENENPIIVLKGIDSKLLTENNKYFNLKIGFFDQIDIEEVEENAMEQVIDQRAFSDKYLWMTMEEFELFKRSEKVNKRPVVILNNNLYAKQVPYEGTLSNVESIYSYLYFQDEVELDTELLDLLNKVSYFYGSINYSNPLGCYYVTYHSFDNKYPVYNLYDIKPIQLKDNGDISTEITQIELSDDEVQFLDMQAEIINGNYHDKILLSFNGDISLLPNKYMERISILCSEYNIDFFVLKKSMKRINIPNNQEYLTILREVYKYDSFRELKFYKNIDLKSKETTYISQVQIIDDIVQQTENAMSGLPFRDIYITSSTGSGKSVMFQIPALFLAKKHSENKPLTLVISPLIGLMNDQVDSMKRRGISSIATVNGNTPLYEKESIIEGIGNYTIDVLYLSPETLQSRTDIKMLISERIIGTIIIDEAHIVTTWGKSFRADYWYLGIYLSKLRKEHKFPIVTFTATAIYGGREDMYLETRNSLNMINPISYFGSVRRDEIFMNVRSSEKTLNEEGRDYRKTKDALALRHLQNSFSSGRKSLVYFPTISLLNSFYAFIGQNDKQLLSVTGKYHGKLGKEEKDEVLSEFKMGEIKFVLATKAFGMGIDIPDITSVYHYAPTGNVVDYVQEIGRAARDNKLVAHGFGVIDFLPKDLSQVKRLHGMSSIKKDQILEVMKKILSVYKEKGYNRNLILSSDDFKYIFVQSKQDEDSLDNKVKTVLLMIEKDFSSPNKLGYSPFVARPRGVYGNELIFVTKDFEKVLLKSELSRYFTKLVNLENSTYDYIYQVQLSDIWENHYRNMSFPSFKYCINTVDEREKLKHNKIFSDFDYCMGVDVSLYENNSSNDVISEYISILGAFEEFASEKRLTESQFTVNDLGNYLMKRLKISDKFESRTLAQVIINSSFEFGKIKSIKFITDKTISDTEFQKYIIHMDTDIFTNFILSSLKRALYPEDNYIIKNGVVTTFYRRGFNLVDEVVASLGIGEARGLLYYQVTGGNNPQIYMRINSVRPLEDAISRGDYYTNNILKDVRLRHNTSVEMLKYLFTREQNEIEMELRIKNYTKWFWDSIEDYFMGEIPETVDNSIFKKNE